jgi:hypothetical protein
MPSANFIESESEPLLDAISHSSVPIEYQKRKRLWINSSLWLGVNELFYAALSIQNLGYAERALLEMEARLRTPAHDHAPRKERDFMRMECSAHSSLWVFGLYEVLRVIKQSGTPKCDPLQEPFSKLEILRMPLAKHEVKHVKGNAQLSHYPTGAWEIETGRTGWIFHDPHSNKSRILTRTGLANEFLSIAAIEPKFPPSFPIGGPLGIDD